MLTAGAGHAGAGRRSNKKKRLLNLRKGDKLHARMFKKKESHQMAE